ncbi:MAG: hypothetical protein ABW128_02720 [Rhizorhabdus sp.]
MDFMKWLNSLDELLYEVMSWLIFFPLTLWRSVRRPMQMMRYADLQLRLPDDEQYADGLSPPLFLTLSLLIAHLAAVALGEVDMILANRHGLAAMITDDTSALVLRVLTFSLFPLLLSVRLVRKRGLPLERKTLRLPFYAQCYPTAVFALGLGLGTALSRLADPVARWGGAAFFCAAILYYLEVERRWFADQLGVSRIRALGHAAAGLIEGFLLMLLAGWLFSR